MIYINGKFLLQRKTGVQRYAFELTALLLNSTLDVRILVPKSANLNNVEFPEIVFIKMGVFSALTLWEQIDLLQYVANKKHSLLLSFCNTGPALLSSHIICIHDMSYRANPKWFSKAFNSYYKILIPLLAKKAQHVVTVSEFSKTEICDHLGLSKDKVSVINNAPSKKFIVPDHEALVFKKDDFFLFVGSHDPRKNIRLLIKLFSSKEFRSHKLIVVGAAGGAFNDQEYRPTNNITFMTDCDDASLAHHYKHARALINSSFYEGFGLPVVEAMASGCPLLLSKIPAFVEVAGKNAGYFDPHSISTLKIAMNIFLKKSNMELRQLIINNYRFSFNYNWNTSCNQLISLIDKLNNEHN